MRYLVLLVWFICLWGANALGQVSPAFDFVNIPPRQSGRYCLGETVKIINQIDPGLTSVPRTARYFFDYDNAPLVFVEPNDPDAYVEHVYGLAGVYKIAQYGGRNASSPPAPYYIDKPVTILPIVPPKFTLGLCENHKIKVDFTDGVYNQYKIDTGSGPFLYPPTPTTVPPQPFEFQYNSTTPRTFKVTGECSAPPASQDFTPILNLISPDLISQKGFAYPIKDSALFLLNFAPNMKYKLLKFDGINWNPIDTQISISSSILPKTFPQVALGTNGDVFRIDTYGACGETKSSVHVMIPHLTAIANAGTSSIDLSWTPLSPTWQGEVSGIQVIRDNVAIANLSRTDILFIDPNVVCGRSYSYSLKIIYNTVNNRAIESSTPPRTVKAESDKKPPSVTNLNNSVQGNSVKLTWDLPIGTVAFYSISRAEDEVNFKFLEFSGYNNYTDGKAEASAKRYCYKVDFKNFCGIFAKDSLVTCNMLLTTVKKSDDTHESTWLPYEDGSIPPLHVYTIEIFDANNKLLQSILVNTNQTYLFTGVDLDQPSYRYRVKVSDLVDPTKFYYSNFTEIKNDLQLFLPDAFTPNQDGDNEVFKAYGKYLKDYTMSIYNRWGELIFYSQNIDQGWDGSYKGVASMPGVYAYVITSKDNSGKEITKKGTVILLK